MGVLERRPTNRRNYFDPVSFITLITMRKFDLVPQLTDACRAWGPSSVFSEIICRFVESIDRSGVSRKKEGDASVSVHLAQRTQKSLEKKKRKSSDEIRFPS